MSCLATAQLTEGGYTLNSLAVPFDTPIVEQGVDVQSPTEVVLPYTGLWSMSATVGLEVAGFDHLSRTGSVADGDGSDLSGGSPTPITWTTDDTIGPVTGVTDWDAGDPTKLVYVGPGGMCLIVADIEMRSDTQNTGSTVDLTVGGVSLETATVTCEKHNNIVNEYYGRATLVRSWPLSYGDEVEVTVTNSGVFPDGATRLAGGRLTVTYIGDPPAVTVSAGLTQTDTADARSLAWQTVGSFTYGVVNLAATAFPAVAGQRLTVTGAAQGAIPNGTVGFLGYTLGVHYLGPVQNVAECPEEAPPT